jgi:hypothetical protein
VPSYFFDTSALVKRYRPEDGTTEVDVLFGEQDSVRLVSRLGVIETVSALATKVRTGEITPDDYIVSRKRFLAEISGRTITVLRLLVGHYRIAERLIDRHSPTVRLRTLDALQLSVALDLRNKQRMDSFVCADQVLCDLAQREGLVVINPGLRP